MMMINMQLINLSLCRYGLEVSGLFKRPISDFKFDLKVEVYMTSSSYKLKMEVGPDEKF